MPHNGFPSSYFKIKNRISGKCLDITKDHNIVSVDDNESTAQHWYADMSGRIINRLRSLVLYCKNPTNGAGLSAEIFTTDSQQWYVDDIGRIISKSNGKSITFDENNKNSIIPVYIWENYNGPSQKWYFENINNSTTTKRLFRRHYGTKQIPPSMIDISAEQTYQCWVKLTKFQSGMWKRIFSRGKHSKGDLGLWILPDNLKLKLCVNGTCEVIPYDMPLNTWINICCVLYSKYTELYIDGILRKKLKLQNVYTPSTDVFRVGTNNLHIVEMEYSNYALSIKSMQNTMQSSDPNILHSIRPGIIGGSAGTPQEHTATEGVTIIAMSSNGTHPDCGGPYNGRLNQYGWCAAAAVTGNYLQLDLDKVYRLTKILTQGRSTGGQWVTSYDLQYLDNKGQYINYDQTLQGNNDANSIKQNNINITTKILRLYPKTWINWPSIRVGLDGTPDHSYKCSQYLLLSTTDKTPIARKLNLDAYNQECRKISYYNYLQKMGILKNKLDKLQDLHLESSAKCKKRDTESDELNSKINTLKKKITSLKLDLELSKSIKCPPRKVCLPVIDPITNNKTADINDFDIRTHKNFYQYVQTNSVKPCLAVEQDKMLLSKLSKAQIEASAMSSKLSKAQIEASLCQSNFNNKIYPHNINSMSGGGIYGKICSLTTMGMGGCKDLSEDTKMLKPICKNKIIQANNVNEESTQKYVQHAFQEDYSITKHKDFNNLMKNYMLKTQCTVRGTQPPEITSHPQYQDLMKKYALRDITTCPNTYKPCPAVIKNNCSEITTHPQYQDLMKKYALRNTATCPNTYKPCPVNIIQEYQALRANIKLHPQYNSMISGEPVNTMKKKSLTEEQKRAVLGSITEHPDIVKYIPIATARSVCNAAINKAKASLAPVYSNIEKHPDYQSLMEKYAIRDTSVCPPIYKPCSTPPDLNNYVSKSKLDTTTKQLIEIQKIAQRQQEAINKLKNLPIESHSQYQVLVEKLSDLNNNPNIHKYILKTQIPSLIDRECNNHFKSSGL